VTALPGFVFSGVVGCVLDAGGVTVSAGGAGVAGVCAGGTCVEGACDEEASCPGFPMFVDEFVPELSGLDASDEALPGASLGLEGCTDGASVDGAPAGALSVWAFSSAAKTDEGEEANIRAADMHKSANRFLWMTIFFI